MNQTKNGWKKKIRKMAKRCVWCAQVEKVSKNSSKESEYLFACSYLRNDNNIDSDDDTVMITIIRIMIMMTMAIMIQSY